MELFHALRALDPSPNRQGPGPVEDKSRFIYTDSKVVYKIARNLAILEPIVAAIDQARLSIVKKYIAPNETQLTPDTEPYNKFMEEWAGPGGHLSSPIEESISLFPIDFAELSVKSKQNIEGNDIPIPVLVSLDPILVGEDADLD